MCYRVDTCLASLGCLGVWTVIRDGEEEPNPLHWLGAVVVVTVYIWATTRNRFLPTQDCTVQPVESQSADMSQSDNYQPGYCVAVMKVEAEAVNINMTNGSWNKSGDGNVGSVHDPDLVESNSESNSIGAYNNTFIPSPVVTKSIKMERASANPNVDYVNDPATNTQVHRPDASLNHLTVNLGGDNKVDVLVKVSKNPISLKLRVNPSGCGDMIGLDKDPQSSEAVTSVILEQMTDGRGTSKLGRKITVLVVMNATTGTFGRGRWRKFVQFTNFKVENIVGVGVIVMRTNEKFNGVGLNDVHLLLNDETVQYWLDKLFVTLWDNASIHPVINSILLEGKLMESRLVSIGGHVTCECFRCWMPVHRYESKAEVLRNLVCLMDKEWTMEKRWRIMRLIQPTDVATVLFNLNEIMGLMMSAIFIITDRQGEMGRKPKAVIGNIVGRGEIYWPKIHNRDIFGYEN